MGKWVEPGDSDGGSHAVGELVEDAEGEVALLVLEVAHGVVVSAFEVVIDDFFAWGELRNLCLAFLVVCLLLLDFVGEDADWRSSISACHCPIVLTILFVGERGKCG